MKAGQRIIKLIEDTDFHRWENGTITEQDEIAVRFIPEHGTVIYVAGVFEDDDDALICMGAKEGETEFRVAVHDGFRAFEKAWYRLNGRMDLLGQIEQSEAFAERMKK